MRCTDPLLKHVGLCKFRGPVSPIHQFRQHNRAFNVSDGWLAQLNLLFAIGTKYSHLTGTDRKGKGFDHTEYMMRAVQLIDSRDTSKAFSGPDLELVQAVSSSYAKSQTVLEF
jgi:hypothetical protein